MDHKRDRQTGLLWQYHTMHYSASHGKNYGQTAHIPGLAICLLIFLLYLLWSYAACQDRPKLLTSS